MAVYVPPGRRRNLTVAIAVVGAVVGLAAGFALGRGTATTVDDRIGDARTKAQELIVALDVLPIEYEQALEGSSETGQISDTVDRAAGRLADTLAEAPWFGEAQRTRVTNAVQSVRDAAARKVRPAQFRAIVARADAVIRAEYGLAPARG